VKLLGVLFGSKLSLCEHVECLLAVVVKQTEA